MYMGLQQAKFQCILIDIVQHKLLLIKETQSNVYMEFADILVIDFFILFMKMNNNLLFAFFTTLNVLGVLVQTFPP